MRILEISRMSMIDLAPLPDSSLDGDEGVGEENLRPMEQEVNITELVQERIVENSPKSISQTPPQEIDGIVLCADEETVEKLKAESLACDGGTPQSSGSLAMSSRNSAQGNEFLQHETLSDRGTPASAAANHQPDLGFQAARRRRHSSKAALRSGASFLAAHRSAPVLQDIAGALGRAVLKGLQAAMRQVQTLTTWHASFSLFDAAVCTIDARRSLRNRPPHALQHSIFRE
jgi:hypothetical protein